MNELQIEDPMVVAEGDGAFILVSRSDVGKPNPSSQLWNGDIGYGRVQSLQVWSKWLQLVDVDPARPWREP